MKLGSCDEPQPRNRGSILNVAIYASLGVPVMFRYVYVEFCTVSRHAMSLVHRCFQAKTWMSTQKNFQGQLKLCSKVPPIKLLKLLDAGIFPTTCKRMRVLAFNVQPLRQNKIKKATVSFNPFPSGVRLLWLCLNTQV
jgi:hypothetical protein